MILNPVNSGNLLVLATRLGASGHVTYKRLSELPIKAGFRMSGWVAGLQSPREPIQTAFGS